MAENGGYNETETITPMEIENGDALPQVQSQEQGKCLITKIDDGSVESHRYYLSRRTTLEMLKDRGYSIPPSEIQLSLHEFRQTHGHSPDVDRLRFTATHTTNPSKRVSLFSHSLSLSYIFIYHILCCIFFADFSDIQWARYCESECGQEHCRANCE